MTIQKFAVGESPNLVIGAVNRNQQTVIEHTDRPGTDRGQRVYMLRCDNPSGCSGGRDPYGVNGTDVHERKCPVCQGGKPGI